MKINEILQDFGGEVKFEETTEFNPLVEKLRNDFKLLYILGDTFELGNLAFKAFSPLKSKSYLKTKYNISTEILVYAYDFDNATYMFNAELKLNIYDVLTNKLLYKTKLFARDIKILECNSTCKYTFYFPAVESV